jgi:thiol reductant ABC exporter CydC subunit
MTPMRDVIALVRRLLAQVPNGVRRLLIAVALAVFATACAVSLTGVSAWLLSRAAEHPNVLQLTAASALVRFFGIGRGVGRYLERLVGHDVAFRMQSALRFITYDKLSRTTLLGRRHGDLLVRITADVEGIVDLVVRVVLPFCSAAVVMVGTSLILTIFSPLFAAVLLVTSIIAGIVMPWLAQRWSLDADQAAVPARGELGDTVRQTARGAADLVAYGVAPDALSRVRQVDGRLRSAEARGAWTRGVASSVQLVAIGVAVAAALVIGGQAVASGAMLGRNLAILALVPLALYEVFADFTKAAQTLTRARTSLGRVLEVLEAEPVGSGDRTAGSEDGVAGLQLRGVDAGWPDAEPILRGVDLEVAPGEAVALVGASGLGKTTLAATVLGLIPVRGGELEVPGRVGYLAQDSHIFASTLTENVKIGNKDATDEQVAQALRLAGLDLDPGRVVGEDGATLSGGEAQRLALARVLVAAERPGLVILDEPTEHLDRETADELLDDLFATLGDPQAANDGQQAVPLLVITHDVELMARCNRVVDLGQWAVDAVGVR